MLRFLLLLLIASLLVCPVRCQAGEATPVRQAAAAGCGCCDDQPAVPSSECPGDGCDCRDCICHGAILGGGTELTAAAVLEFAAAVSIVGQDLDLRLAEAGSLADLVSRCCVYASGRAVRIAHQSLLI